jgi:hypothetical protein
VDDGDRTHDNRDHNPGLYQLSYVHHRLHRAAGAPGRTRTCDPRLRRPMLYPPELRAPFKNQILTAPAAGLAPRIQIILQIVIGTKALWRSVVSHGSRVTHPRRTSKPGEKRHDCATSNAQRLREDVKMDTGDHRSTRPSGAASRAPHILRRNCPYRSRGKHTCI